VSFVYQAVERIACKEDWSSSQQEIFVAEILAIIWFFSKEPEV